MLREITQYAAKPPRYTPTAVRLHNRRRYEIGGDASRPLPEDRSSGPSLPNISHRHTHRTPTAPKVPNAACQPWAAMIQAIRGATMPVPKAAPLATTLVGSARFWFPNHLYTACTATGKAGPSAAPSTTRLPASTAKLEMPLKGNKVNAQTAPIAAMMVLVRTRFATKPTRTPE